MRAKFGFIPETTTDIALNSGTCTPWHLSSLGLNLFWLSGDLIRVTGSEKQWWTGYVLQDHGDPAKIKIGNVLINQSRFY